MVKQRKTQVLTINVYLSEVISELLEMSKLPDKRKLMITNILQGGRKHFILSKYAM